MISFLRRQHGTEYGKRHKYKKPSSHIPWNNSPLERNSTRIERGTSYSEGNDVTTERRGQKLFYKCLSLLQKHEMDIYTRVLISDTTKLRGIAYVKGQSLQYSSGSTCHMYTIAILVSFTITVHLIEQDS